jgi:hypothetical protein
MEPTITQNSALYLAHRKVSKRRATFFRWLRTLAGKQGGRESGAKLQHLLCRK